MSGKALGRGRGGSFGSISSRRLFTLALAVLLVLGACNQYGKMREIGFNYFNRPASDEIYLTEYGQGGYVAYSSAQRNCSVCGREVALLAGENRLGAEGCEKTVLLECSGRSLWYEKAVSASAKAVGPNPADNVYPARPYPFALLLSLVLSLLLAFALIRKISVSGVLAGIGICFSALALHFQFEALGFWWLVPALLMGTLALSLLRGKRLPLPQFGWKPALGISAAFALFILLLNVSIGTLDIWSSYYNRQADLTLLNWSPAYLDQLSYLGRASTYPPAFFNLAASIGGLALFPSFTYFREPFQLCLAFLFALATYAAFHRFSRRGALIATSFILLQWFFTMTATTLSLHTFAYIMLTLSLLVPFPLAALFLGVAFATHPITLFAYPFYHFATRKFELGPKEIIRVGTGAALLSLAFYLPVFLKSGLPYEIVPERWGYFFTYGLNGMHFEFLLLLPLIALCATAIRDRRYRLPALAVIALALLNAFVLYRVNILLTVMLAALFPLAFENELGKKENLALLTLFLACNVALIPVIHSGTADWCTWGVANDMCISPMNYLASHTEANETVAINPMYGHLEAYVGKRPVLADLYVEYADLGKFNAEDRFTNYGDISGLRGYGVTLAVEDETAWPPRPDRKNLGTQDGDRIYDNGFIHITRLKG